MVLQAVSEIHFYRFESISDLLTTALNYITSNSLPPQFASQSLEFLSYVVREIDCTAFIVQIMPKLVQNANIFPSLRFFENFLRAPVMSPAVTWTPLSEICNSKDATQAKLHSALDAINRSALVPPPDSFSFEPFAKNFAQLENEDKLLLFHILSRCDPHTKCEFITSAMPLESTKVDTECLLRLIAETQWGKDIGVVLSATIINIDADVLRRYITEIADYFAICNAACDQIFGTCKQSVPVLIKLFEIARSDCELVSSLISKVIERTNIQITMPQIVTEISKPVPAFVLDALQNCARRILQFNEEFFKQDYVPALTELTKSLSGIGLISGLALDGPLEQIDSFVESNWNLFEQYDNKTLDNLMRGLPPKSESTSYIKIPSLIPHIENIQATTPFDKYLLGKYLKNPTREQIKQFIAQSFSSAECFEKIRNDPELLYLSSLTTEPQRGIVQFHPQARQCSGHILLKSATSLWIYPYETVGRTTIVQYSDSLIELNGNCLILFGQKEVRPIAIRQWHLITLLSSDTNIIGEQCSVTVYIDTVNCGTFSLTKPKNLIFGALECSSPWMLSAAFILDDQLPQDPERYVKKVYEQSPYVATVVSFSLQSGPKTVPYEGIVRFIPSFGGKAFIFDKLLNCPEDKVEDFKLLLKTTLNMFNIRIYSEQQFFRMLRYVIFRKESMYSKDVENILFDGITENGEVKWGLAFVMFSDFRLMMSKYINFSFTDRLIQCPAKEITPEIQQFLNILFDTFVFFRLSQSAFDNCLNLIEIFVQRFPVLLKRISCIIIALPHIETPAMNKDLYIHETYVADEEEEKVEHEVIVDKDAKLSEKQLVFNRSNENYNIRPLLNDIIPEDVAKEQIEKQQKLLKILTRSPEMFLSVFSDDRAISIVSLISDDLALEYLDFLANISKENRHLFNIKEFKKLKPLLRRKCSEQKMWMTLFHFLTGKKLNSISDYAESEFPFVRVELIGVMFSLIRNITTPATDKMCVSILRSLSNIIRKINQPLTQYTKEIQSMCSLGFNEQSLSQMPFSLSLQPEDSLKIKRKLSSKSIKMSFDGSNTFSAQKFISEINDIDSFLYQETIDYLTQSHAFISFDKEKVLDKSNDDNPSFIPDNIESYYSMESTKLISRIAAQCLLESALKLNDTQFKQSLIRLTIFGSDTHPKVSIKMHQEVILSFLSLREFGSDSFPIEPKQTVFDFLAFRVAEGWWENSIQQLFSLALPLLAKCAAKAKDAASKFVITSLSQCKKVTEKIQVAKMFVDSDLFSVIVADSIFFSTFLCLIINNEMIQESTLKESRALYELISSKIAESDLKAALIENKQVEWLNMRAHVQTTFLEYYNQLITETQSNSSALQKERLFIAAKSKTRKHAFVLKKSLAHATLLKRSLRHQFFMHFNISSSAVNFAIDTLFKHMYNEHLDAKYYSRQMFGVAPSPMVPPIKLLPNFIEYEATYQKVSTPLIITKSVHEQPFETIFSTLNKPEEGPRCYSGWRFPKFISEGVTNLAKSLFKPIAQFVPCAVLVTPESLPSVIIITRDSLNVLLNASFVNNQILLHGMNDLIYCHSGLVETAPFGVIANTTLFFNHTVLVFPWTEISTTIPRKYIHENTALDLYTYTGGSITLVMSESDRKAIIGKTNPIKSLNQLRGPLFYNKLAQQFQLEDCSKIWSQYHALNTLEYLLYLNAQGLRSFSDLSQYPVVPWVVSDYLTENGYKELRDLSKPLGMIGEQRAKRFETMYRETDNHYFYGTHYSYPAVVFHFMMRIEPYTLYNVNLHHGFDHKDRLFCNIAESWKSAGIANQADLKELIPQFFCTSEMLTNVNKLPLSERTDGTSLANVVLPPWAKTPIDFIWVNRAVLESDESNEKLPDWIDLIFGYKQKGQEAIDACNVYHPLTYEDTELKHNDDPREMKAQIDAINNFGQCPHQIFEEPHIRYEHANVPQNLLCEDVELNVVELRRCNEHCTAVKVISDEQRIIATRKYEHIMNGINVIFIKERYFEINRKIQISDYNFFVNCSNVSSDDLFIVTASLTGVVTVFMFRDGRMSISMKAFCNETINACAVSSHLALVVAASEKHVFLIDLTSSIIMKTVPVRDVRFIAIDETCYFIVLCSKREISVMTHNMETVCTYKISLNTGDITALNVTDSIRWTKSPFFVTGHADGAVNIWTIDVIGRKLTQKQVMKTTILPVSCVCIAGSGSAVVAVNDDGSAHMAVAANIGRAVLKSDSFSSCPICCHVLIEKSTQMCPVCGLPICHNCWTGDMCTACKAKISVDAQEQSESEEEIDIPQD